MQTPASSAFAPLNSGPALQPAHGAADHHHLRRRFIGPMPQRALAEAPHPGKRAWFRPRSRSSSGSSDSDSEDSESDALAGYAFRYFLARGGREEEWGAAAERSARREMLARWRAGAWGRAHAHAPEARVRWVGASFEVGEFAGVNVLDAGVPSVSEMRSRRSASSSRPSALSRDTADTFATARTELSAREPDTGEPVRRTSSPEPIELDDVAARPYSSTSQLLATSPILPPEHATFARDGPAPPARAASDGILRAPDGRAAVAEKRPLRVRIQTAAGGHEHAPADTPASPTQVLRRDSTAMAMEGTSAAAAAAVQAAHAVPPGADVLGVPHLESERDGIVMRDRMLVRVSFAQDPTAAAKFDEEANRTAQHLESREWDEFLVVWRERQIELYSNWRIPLRERLLGHKRLAYLIPLARPLPKLTLYSFTDASFALASNAAVGSHEGLRTAVPFYRVGDPCVYVFKPRTRTRAADWVWHLWRRLGGTLPPYIEVRSPIMGAALRVEVPPLDGAADAAVFGPDNLVKLCLATLQALPDWRLILQRRLAEGARLGLAWRYGTSLDWVWWTHDLRGDARGWAVLAGLAVAQPGKPAQLEIRIGEHAPSFLHLQDGARLLEPPPAEGYVSRVRPRSRARQAVYLTVHHGMLFTLAPANAHPPRPPGTLPRPNTEEDESIGDALRTEEVARGARQVLLARGVTDLRAVLLVRRAAAPVPATHERVDLAPAAVDALLAAPLDPELDANEDDTAGEGGLTRCFELVTTGGRVVRFAAPHARAAREWVARLRELVRYWRARHAVDARQEMDAVHAATGRARITPHVRRHDDGAPEGADAAGAVLPYLSSLYHWCVYEGCRPIAKTGKIYVRRGARGKYRLVHLVLAAGYLVQFRVRAGAAFQHRAPERVSLRDAYAVSGVLAAQSLPAGQVRPGAAPAARRYRDGLEADDREEDTLFVLLYHAHALDAPPAQAPPALGAGRKTLVFRARSKVERDLWCWAIGVEIEKVARGQAAHEMRVREEGGVCLWKGDVRRARKMDEAEAAAEACE